MQVYHQLHEITSKIPHSSVAIGNFDGCHLGHQALLGRMLSFAKLHGLTPTVMTFYPHPVEVLNPGKPLERLMTASEKLAELERLGVEMVFVASFDKNLAELSPLSFYQDYLRDGLRAKSLHVGHGFRFGKARAGNTEILGEWCKKDGIEMDVMEPLATGSSKETQKISSTLVRGLIRDGKVAEATTLLRKAYSVSGQVLHGNKRGTTIGFPTANLHVPAEKVLPKNGVYITRAFWQKQSYPSVTNVGIRPTFYDEPGARPVFEVHLLDFKARLYDEYLRLEFLDRVRDEKKFDSVESLKAQIQKDVAYARESRYFK